MLQSPTTPFPILNHAIFYLIALMQSMDKFFRTYIRASTFNKRKDGSPLK